MTRTQSRCKTCNLALRDQEERVFCVGCEIYEGLKEPLQLELMEGCMLMSGVIVIGNYQRTFS